MSKAKSEIVCIINICIKMSQMTLKTVIIPNSEPDVLQWLKLYCARCPIGHMKYVFIDAAMVCFISFLCLFAFCWSEESENVINVFLNGSWTLTVRPTTANSKGCHLKTYCTQSQCGFLENWLWLYASEHWLDWYSCETDHMAVCFCIMRSRF